MLDAPVATERFSALSDFTPETGAVYVFARSPEDRSIHLKSWEERAAGVTFVGQQDETETAVRLEVGAETSTLALRSRVALQTFWQAFGASVAYLDITGFSHHVWAPLLRAALDVVNDVRVVYVEPGEYTRSPIPTEGEIFDLSERIQGIAPLPGFASLGPRATEAPLVALLGFEGTRFSHVLEEIQPDAASVIPIIGVPGFRAEYPFYTFHGNKLPLIEGRAWTRARYVTANCPFSVFRAVMTIIDESGTAVRVAPIGTKPHSLGAVLLASAKPNLVELVYDHPLRTAKRTIGAARTLVYHVGPMFRHHATV